MNIQVYLNQTGDKSREVFLADHPNLVLVEVESQPGSPADDVGVTERLDSAFVRRQATSSRDSLVFELRSGDPVLVGRAPACQLVIDHQSVSKEHARFSWSDGQLMVEDLASTNGTSINHKRLEPHTPTRAVPDDGIRFGKATGFHLMGPGGFFDYLALLRRFGL